MVNAEPMFGCRAGLFPVLTTISPQCPKIWFSLRPICCTTSFGCTLLGSLVGSQALLATAERRLVEDLLSVWRRETEAFRAEPRVHGMATSWLCAVAMIEFRNLLLAILLVSCRGLCVRPLLRWIRV